MTPSLCFRRLEVSISLEKYLENDRKLNKDKSLMLHLGRKSQVNKYQVMNSWVCSTTPEKDLNIAAMNSVRMCTRW